MNFITISSYNNLQENLVSRSKSFVVLYKNGSAASDCLLDNFNSLPDDNKIPDIFLVDVSQVPDIHNRFGVTSVPAIIEFENEKLINLIKGCQSADFLRSLLFSGFFKAEKVNAKEDTRRVTVYTTPTCSWCRTLKRYLDDNRIHYTEVDVSKDQRQAEEMVKKSGQQGVPQTNINGTVVVGFDQARINQLLGINRN